MEVSQYVESGTSILLYVSALAVQACAATFMPFIEQGEIANLPAYSYCVRISAVRAQETMSGMAVVVE